MPDFQKILQNPVLLASAALLVLTAALLLFSLSLLTTAVLYSPEVGVYVAADRQSSGSVDAGAIGERNFFGLADAQPVLDAMEDLPETTLALILRGAFAGGSKEQAGAIIENEETKVTDHYAIGEDLPGDAVLKAIYADRVVLTRNGLLETLYFPDLAGTSGIGATKNTQSGGNLGIPSVESDAARQRREAIRERIRQLRKR